MNSFASKLLAARFKRKCDHNHTICIAVTNGKSSGILVVTNGKGRLTYQLLQMVSKALLKLISRVGTCLDRACFTNRS